MVLKGSITALTLTDSILENHAYNSYQLAWLTKLINTRNVNLIKDQEHM